MIEGCTRCVNQGRLMNIEIAVFIKHWGRKGGIEIRRRGVDIVTNELQNLAHTGNRALQHIYHDGHTRSAQLTDRQTCL